MRSVGSWLSHPDSLRAFVWQRAETEETWESENNVFFDDGFCVIWLLVFVPFSVSPCVFAYILHALCIYCLGTLFLPVFAGVRQVAEGQFKVWLIFYISGDYYYWVVGMNSQQCVLPEGCITYHWAFLQPCCNALAIWYCCHNALAILFCHFVVCSVMIKGPIAQ